MDNINTTIYLFKCLNKLALNKFVYNIYLYIYIMKIVMIILLLLEISSLCSEQNKIDFSIHNTEGAPSKNINTWNKSEVIHWLRSIDLEGYSKEFCIIY